MSSTPRKKRHHQPNSSTHAHPPAHSHQRTRSQLLVAQAAASANQITSDYESDTASYMVSNPPPPNPALGQRSNNEINMTVLRRYIPSITHIHSIASNAVVYTYDPSSEEAGFEKANIEGPLFTCQRNGSDIQNCVFILNRKSTDNLRLDLANVTNFESQGDMLYMQIMGPRGEPKVWGLYIHDSSDNRREIHTNAILSLWHSTKEARALQSQPALLPQYGHDAVHVVPGQGGRQISINELLKR
ncbi:Dcp1-like decapping family protein [Seiridium cupressi]